MKVIFCGDRKWSNKDVIRKAFLELAAEYNYEPLYIVEGGAPGADSLSREVIEEEASEIRHLRTITTIQADWDNFGVYAGPRRNQQMLDTHPDLVYAFHDNLEESKGTKHMVRIAEHAGIPIRVYKNNGSYRDILPKYIENGLWDD